MSEKITSMMRAVSIADFPFNLELNGNSDEPAGKIVVNKGEVTFSGNFDKAAQIFVENIAKRWSQQWKKHEKSATEYDRFMEVVEVAHKALEKGTPLDLESLFKGELASAMFATMFAGEFVRHGAKNYLELTYNVPKLGEFTVTIQRKNGKTPCERIEELEAIVAQRTGECVRLINERDALREEQLNKGSITRFAAENVALKSALNDILQPDAAVLERNHRVRALDAMETPATDAFLAEVRTEVIEWLDAEISAIDPVYRGDPSYEHDAYWMKGKVRDLIQKSRELFAAQLRQEAAQ